MDDFLGFGGLFDVDGDGSLDADKTAYLELMDAEERAEILEEAGYEPDDFDFDL